MSSEHGLTAATDAAWAAFRGRLADHIFELECGGDLGIELAADPDECPPYVVLSVYDVVEISAAGNRFLGDLYQLGDAEEEEALHEAGWVPAPADDDLDVWTLELPQREADRAAFRLVELFRDLYGVAHPAFLTAEGLESDPESAIDVAPTCAGMAGPDGDDDPALAVMPASRDHLQQLVDDAMGEVFPDLKHYPDGDIPIRCGRSTLFVRVLADRPAVELFAELVIEPDDHERVLVELALLNAAHALWQFRLADEVVVMRHEILALPFSAFQLRLLVDRFCDDVDRLAHELATRVGGRLFLDPPLTDDGADDDEEHDPLDASWDLVMTGLLELCHLGRPRATTVAGLFDRNRLEIIRQIVRIRTGVQTCDGHDEDVVLGALRRALRLVSDGERAAAVPLPPRPRSVQATLLSDTDLGEESLDLGWGG